MTTVSIDRAIAALRRGDAVLVERGDSAAWLVDVYGEIVSVSVAGYFEGVVEPVVDATRLAWVEAYYFGREPSGADAPTIRVTDAPYVARRVARRGTAQHSFAADSARELYH